MYIDILRRLSEAVRKKRPPKWRTTVFFNFSAPVGFGQGFLSKEQYDNIEESPTLS
jgi:hypothetical protein